MSSWEIEPAEVRAVLGKVQPEIEALDTATNEDQLSQLLTAVVECNNLIPTDCVEAAMLLFMQDQMTELGTINNHLAAGVVGVSTAVSAYQHGNDQMATAANRQMWETRNSGDFSWFAENTEAATTQQESNDTSYLPGGRS